MNVIIIEDEKLAQENLAYLLKELRPEINIVAILDSVNTGAKWLKQNTCDLIFLDIHLGDGLSFEIFEQVSVKTPIIFTTAYDQYALQAFKLTSIDYLLKPIDQEELGAALGKLDILQPQPGIDYQKLRTVMSQEHRQYQKRFMVQRGEKILSVVTEDIAWFEGEDRYVYLVKKDGSRYIIDFKLGELEELLDPSKFYRLNRSFISCFEAIDKIFAVSKSRVQVFLKPKPKRQVIVSSEKTRAFKMWLNS